MAWNPDQYLRFARERNLPVRDLLRQIDHLAIHTAVDLGCGPGNSTGLVAETFPDAHVTGMDTSPEMISKACETYPDLTFVCEDVRSLTGTYDLLFSNACLQWVPDHNTLFPALFAHLAPGGTLALQMPMNADEPLFRIIRETADAWHLRHAEKDYTLTPQAYFSVFAGLTEDFRIWETRYYHPMESHDDLLAFVKGSRLRPYLAHMRPEEGEAFEQEILSRAIQAYPFMRDGRVVLGFRRFFAVVHRPQ